MFWSMNEEVQESLLNLKSIRRIILDRYVGQFLKELRENTFSGPENEDANEYIERVIEIVDLFTTPDMTQDQLMLHVFPITLTRAASRCKYFPPSRTAKKMEEINNFQQEPDETLYQAWERFKELLLGCPQHYLTSMKEVILFYKGLDVPTRQILNSTGEIRASTDAAIRNQGASIKELEIQIGQMSKVFSIWKAFEGNTRDLCSFGEEMDKTTDLHQHLSRLCSQRLETASPVLHDAVTTHFVTASQPFMTALASTTQPKI
ncbi:retrovirus-related pol polyprotein from transposon TNT 1-94 [Tanacetum coccineum]|uniref:Retrovirus-related pol polyprotein from transposon TNT 1-94 n=1 Tax=Tanacetum coccineum TaxID=301880 RepID=A0ABQ5D9L2_9ASTR